LGQLGEDHAVYVLVTVIKSQNARRQQILDSLRDLLVEMTHFERLANSEP
jgi:hypothetical protein